jgi:hypothetical protein
VAATRESPLSIGRWPAGGSLLGLYRTGGAEARHRTLLAGIDPLRGSCDCRDFVENGLGLCEHLLGLAGAIAGREDARRRRGVALALGGPRLAWSPLHPLLGPGDWLDRLTLVGPSLDPGAKSPRRIPRALAEATRRFDDPAAGALRRLRQTYADDPHRRLALSRELLEAARASDRGRARARFPADPAVPALLQREIERLEPRTARSWCRPEVRAALATLRRPLAGRHHGDLDALLQRGRALYAAPAGYQRVTVAVALAHVLCFSGCVRRAAVVVPPELKRDWLAWWRQLSGIPAAAVEGSPAQRAALYADWHRGALLVDFEQISHDAAPIEANRPELVIADEGRHLRDWTDRGAAAALRVCAPYRLLLAAPPLAPRLRRLGAMIGWIDELALAPGWRLIPLHGEPHDERRGEVAAVHQLETLADRLEPCVVQRTDTPPPELARDARPRARTPSVDRDRTARGKREHPGPTTAHAGEALPACRHTRALPPPLPRDALSPADGRKEPGAGGRKGGVDLDALCHGLRLERAADGRLTIHAAPEVAAPLATFFSQLAARLRASGPP